ncbi:MAG: hypothetical protein QOF52_730 [Propionibacteriaceae bacterium]|jgi:hypothetical protein|nr:hypothetical protein [Propionibacteriaceae bacterium]MDX6320872.1 hypothetical protein [Propionibacteriaceae bacterium]
MGIFDRAKDAPADRPGRVDDGVDPGSGPDTVSGANDELTAAGRVEQIDESAETAAETMDHSSDGEPGHPQPASA